MYIKKNMKLTTFGLSNWFKQNTPKLSQIIGDVGLVLALLNGVLLWFASNSTTIQSLVGNTYFNEINKVMLAIGITTKFLSKFFGEIQLADKLPPAKMNTDITPEELHSAIAFALYNNLQTSQQVIQTLIQQLNLFDQSHPAIKAMLSNKQLFSYIDTINKKHKQ